MSVSLDPHTILLDLLTNATDSNGDAIFALVSEDDQEEVRQDGFPFCILWESKTDFERLTATGFKYNASTDLDVVIVPDKDVGDQGLTDLRNELVQYILDNRPTVDGIAGITFELVNARRMYQVIGGDVPRVEMLTFRYQHDQLNFQQ